MPSTLDRAIVATRKAILDRNDEAVRRLLLDYQASHGRLRPLIAALQAEVSALGPDAGAGRVQELDRLRQLERLIVQETDRLSRSLAGEIAAGRADAVRLGADAAERLMQAAGADPGFVRLPTVAVRELAGALAPGSPLADLLAGLGEDAGAGFRAELLDAIVRGRSPDAVAETVSATMDVGRRRSLLIARTEILRAHRGAALATYREHPDILSGWRWTCAQQTRSCLSCLANDGRIFPLSQTFMRAHPGCRCAAIPLVRGEALVLETGAEWVAAQPDAVQQEMIPAALWDEWARGDVVLPDFVALRRSTAWGSSYGEASIPEVRANAAKRVRMAA